MVKRIVFASLNAAAIVASAHAASPKETLFRVDSRVIDRSVDLASTYINMLAAQQIWWRGSDRDEHTREVLANILKEARQASVRGPRTAAGLALFRVMPRPGRD